MVNVTIYSIHGSYGIWEIGNHMESWDFGMGFSSALWLTLCCGSHDPLIPCPMIPKSQENMGNKWKSWDFGWDFHGRMGHRINWNGTSENHGIFICPLANTLLWKPRPIDYLPANYTWWFSIAIWKITRGHALYLLDYYFCSNIYVFICIYIVTKWDFDL